MKKVSSLTLLVLAISVLWLLVGLHGLPEGVYFSSDDDNYEVIASTESSGSNAGEMVIPVSSFNNVYLVSLKSGEDVAIMNTVSQEGILVRLKISITDENEESLSIPYTVEHDSYWEEYEDGYWYCSSVIPYSCSTSPVKVVICDGYPEEDYSIAVSVNISNKESMRE